MKKTKKNKKITRSEDHIAKETYSCEVQILIYVILIMYHYSSYQDVLQQVIGEFFFKL